jgi:succinoglycan biosynthesis protein ExoV
MQLVYYKGKLQNFGDDLNRVIWPALAPELFDGTSDDGFLGIGTIIGMPTKCSHLHVFSSGLGYDSLDSWSVPRTVWCVRGPLTAKLFGCCSSNAALTDGAILSPVALSVSRVRKAAKQVGVIPHWESMQFPGWEEACALAGATLISPIGPPVEVIEQLLSVELVLTESLHGAILADTYGIPWVSFLSSGNFSVFKWKDWTMSVEVALRPMVLLPPTAAPMLRFGYPPGARWGQVVSCDEEAALHEFALRCGSSQSTGSSKTRLRNWLKGSPLALGALDRFLALSPERTADAIDRAARLEPILSRASTRECARQQTLDRLDKLCQLAGVRVRV